jgi:hypothetical protein
MHIHFFMQICAYIHPNLLLIYVLYPYTYCNDKPNEGVGKAHEWIARTLVNYLTDTGVHENLSKR